MKKRVRFFAIRLIPIYIFLIACGAKAEQPFITLMTRSDSLMLAADVRIEMDSARHAIDLLQEAVHLDPELAEGYARLGTAYLESRERKKQWKKARQAFEKALSLNPDLAEAHDGLGQIALYQKEDIRGARTHFEKAIALAPQSQKIRYHLDLVRLLQEDRSLKRASERALERDSTDVAACKIMAEHHKKKDEWDRVINLYERCVQQTPEDLDVAYKLGIIYAMNERFAELRDLLVHLGNAAETRHFLPLIAQVFLYEGDGERAVRIFRNYIRLLDAAEAALYRDISLLASIPELESLSRVTSAIEREAFLRRFWIRHDLSRVSGGFLRQAEHYRRVWHARTHFSKAIYPWDRRGEVYIRYGEPDYRSTSDRLNADMPAKAQRIKERMAVDLYGPDAVGEFFTGPVYPVRSNRAFSPKAPNPQDLGLTSDEIQLIFLLEDAQDAERTELSERVEAADAGEGDQVTRIEDQEQTLAALGDVNTGDLSFSPSRVRQERFVDQAMGLFMPVTNREDASIVPWESWVYTMVAEGLEVTFTDEYFQSNFEFAPVPTHVPNELKERYVAVRDLTDFLYHSPELVLNKMAGRIPDFHDFARDAQPLDFWYRTASFKGKDGRTRLEIYSGIPPDSLLKKQEGTWVIRSAALTDPEVDQTYRDERKFFLDETFLQTSVDTSSGWQNLVLDMAAIEAPPGTYELGLRVREAETRRFQIYQQQVVLEDYSRADLNLSDIELAWSISDETPSEGVFVKQGLNIMPMSVWAFPEKHPAFLYFEIYHLSKNEFGQTHYRVTYDIRSKDQMGQGARVLAGLGRLLGKAEGEQGVSVTYDQIGNTTDGLSYVELNLDGAGKGDHEVQITVEDLVSGVQVRKKTTFGIR
ncbi:MAG: GWxTD domain-containing protein [Gemmatimonadetes bacterium]|nr:GWxTD domain-containing protein [Gemmatimonadota bacterium]